MALSYSVVTNINTSLAIPKSAYFHSLNSDFLLKNLSCKAETAQNIFIIDQSTITSAYPVSPTYAYAGHNLDVGLALTHRGPGDSCAFAYTNDTQRYFAQMSLLTFLFTLHVR